MSFFLYCEIHYCIYLFNNKFFNHYLFYYAVTVLKVIVVCSIAATVTDSMYNINHLLFALTMPNFNVTNWNQYTIY